jgi:hypothetical protein
MMQSKQKQCSQHGSLPRTSGDSRHIMHLRPQLGTECSNNSFEECVDSLTVVVVTKCFEKVAMAETGSKLESVDPILVANRIRETRHPALAIGGASWTHGKSSFYLMTVLDFSL